MCRLCFSDLIAVLRKIRRSAFRSNPAVVSDLIFAPAVLSADSRRSSPDNMAKDIEEGQTSQPIDNTATTSSSNTTGNNTRVRAKADPVLATCRCFNFVTVMASILCIIVNVISAIRSFKNVSDIFDGIFRCYAVIIAIFVIVAETEWSFIIKFWKVLEYWAGRGMLQIFVAVMTRAYPDISGERHEILLLRDIASYMLLACGFIYVLLGVLCLGFLKRARQNKEVSSHQAIKDLQDLERR